jgi:hypothetical protein
MLKWISAFAIILLIGVAAAVWNLGAGRATRHTVERGGVERHAEPEGTLR